MSEIEHSRVLEIVEKLELKETDIEAGLSLIANEAQADDPIVQEGRLTSFEQLAVGKSKRVWVVWVLCILAVMAIAYGLQNTATYSKYIGLNSPMANLESGEKIEHHGKYTAEESLILYGDESQSDPVMGAFNLWQSEPENPVYYIYYCNKYYNFTDTYPTDMEEVGSRIDPDNAWYIAMKIAALELEKNKVITKVRAKVELEYEDRPACSSRVWEVNDAEKYTEALVQLEKIFTKRKITDYELDLLKQRLDIVTADRDFDMVTAMEPLAITVSTGTSALRYLKVHDLFSVRFYDFSQTASMEDKAEVMKWISAYKSFLRRSGTELILVDQLVVTASMRSNSVNMLEAAKRVGLDDEAVKFVNFIEQLNADKILMDTRGFDRGDEEFLQKASIMSRLAVPSVGNKSVHPIDFDTELLTPSRMAEHSFVGRIFTWLFCCLFGLILLIIVVCNFSRSSCIRQLGRRVVCQLTVSDWLAILGVGVVFPVSFYLWIVTSSAWSAREFSVVWPLPGLMFAVQLQGMLYLAISLSLNMLKLRMHKRLESLIDRPSIWDWLASGIAFLLIPLVYYISVQSSIILAIVGLGGVYIVFWILARLCKFWFSPHGKLDKASMSFGLLAPFSLLVICLLSLSLYHHQEEKDWVMQDELFVSHRGEPQMTSYEGKIAEQMQKEIKERLDLLE